MTSKLSTTVIYDPDGGCSVAGCFNNCFVFIKIVDASGRVLFDNKLCRHCAGEIKVAMAFFGKLRKSPSEQRFWDKVQKRGPDECWLWTGHTDWGYGTLKVNGKAMKATRYSLLLSGVRVPADKVACHKCDTPLCVNPSHLFIGTNAENSADMVSKGRSLSGDRNPSAKLTPEQVLEIVAKANAGQNYESLAREYGLCYGAYVAKICNGQNWSTVTGIQPTKTSAREAAGSGPDGRSCGGIGAESW